MFIMKRKGASSPDVIASTRSRQVPLQQRRMSSYEDQTMRATFFNRNPRSGDGRRAEGIKISTAMVAFTDGLAITPMMKAGERRRLHTDMHARGKGPNREEQAAAVLRHHTLEFMPLFCDSGSVQPTTPRMSIPPRPPGAHGW